MPQLGSVNETLSLAIESLERLHEVGESSGLGLVAGRLEDGQDLFELVLLVAWTNIDKTYSTVVTPAVSSNRSSANAQRKLLFFLDDVSTKC